MTPEDVAALSGLRKQQFLNSAKGSFTCTTQQSVERTKGTYGVIYAKPSKTMAANLGVSREILVLITTFSDQQTRTTEALEHIIQESQGRLESHTAIVVHEDPDGNNKLKNWGRERGIVVLPIQGAALANKAFSLESYLAIELFSHDPFDITGPVSDDLNFFGRKDEALDLARKLQQSTVRTCLGLRKIGKTSFLNRIIHVCEEEHDCHIVFVDCSKDIIWQQTAPRLVAWIAAAVAAAVTTNISYLSLDSRPVPSADLTIEQAGANLQRAVQASTKPVIVIIDEVDYITPGSPTASEKWIRDFNILWRNFRGVYQEITRSGQNLSVLIAGVSSKWFFVERIEGIENAALSLIPEQYLSPLARKATEAMMKHLAKRAGLQFDAVALAALATAAGDLPYWCRKLGSFLHRNIPISGRPRVVSQPEVEELTEKFIEGEGAAIARVAVTHLVAVFPEIKRSIEQCSRGEGQACNVIHAGILERYGVLRAGRVIAGRMMEMGVKLALVDDETTQAIVTTTSATEKPELNEWAEELAAVGKRRNVFEKKLRALVSNGLRMDSLTHKEKPSAKERVLKAVNEKRRLELSKYSLDDLMDKLFWLELIGVVIKEWSLFERVFGDGARFQSVSDLINERPDAHAKNYDAADFALYRRSLKTLEEALVAID